VLQAVMGDVAGRRQVAGNLIANGADMRELVRTRLQSEPLPHHSPFSTGWRAKHILPELLQVLDGKRSIRVTDLQAEMPFSVE
jgi:ribonuclease D